MRARLLLTLPIAAGLVALTGCTAVAGQSLSTLLASSAPPSSPSTTTAPRSACVEHTDCTAVGAADLDGDGRLDAIGQIVTGDDRTVVVRLANGSASSIDINRSLWPAQQSLINEPLQAYRLEGGAGAQLVVPVSSGPVSTNFAVVAWRNGALAMLQPAGSTLRPMDGGFSLWSLQSGEGRHTRILCTSTGIEVGEAFTSYGHSPAGQSTLTPYEYKPPPATRGHSVDFVPTGPSRNVSAQSITGPQGSKFFGCESAFSE